MSGRRRGRPPGPDPIREKLRRLEQAREALLRASVSTYESGEDHGVAGIYYAALALLRLHQADGDGAHSRRVIEILEQVRIDRRDPAEIAARASRDGLGL